MATEELKIKELSALGTRKSEILNRSISYWTRGYFAKTTYSEEEWKKYFGIDERVDDLNNSKGE